VRRYENEALELGIRVSTANAGLAYAANMVRKRGVRTDGQEHSIPRERARTREKQAQEYIQAGAAE